MADDRSARLAAAESALTKVLSLAPNHAMAHYLLGHVQIFYNRTAQGIVQCERALTLDRNLAVAHGLIGAAKYFSGRTDLVLIAVDPKRLGDGLRFEPSRGGALFPHLYAPLPLDAVVSVKPLPPKSGGGHDFSGLLGKPTG